MRFIDTHTHIFPDDLAPRSLATLVNKFPKNIQSELPTSNGTFDGLVESMKNSGIDISVVLPVDTNPKHFETVNKWAKEIRADVRFIERDTFIVKVRTIELDECFYDE